METMEAAPRKKVIYKHPPASALPAEPPLFSFQKLPPLIKWSGGKADEIKHFVHYIPTDAKTYIEPFAGGASVFFYTSPRQAVLSDVHPELMDLYRQVAEGHASEIYEFMKDHPNDEATYYQVREWEPMTPLQNAQRFYYLRKTCFRGMLRYNKNGKFNIPFGKYKTIQYESLQDPRYTTLLQQTTFHNDSFEQIFATYNSPDNFMFLDPPYDSVFTDYGYCSFGKAEHEKLAECFKTTRNRCLMVIGHTDFIEELYKDYIVDRFHKKYKFKIHSNRVGNEIDNVHLVIKNY